MARPKKQIDEKGVLKLAKLMCTHKEIAAFFEVSTDTIARRFADTILKGHEVGKMSLRRTQFKLAKKSPALCIWLGKQYLGQSEKVVIDTEDVVNEELVFEQVPKEGNGRFARYYN